MAEFNAFPLSLRHLISCLLFVALRELDHMSRCTSCCSDSSFSRESQYRTGNRTVRCYRLSTSIERSDERASEQTIRAGSSLPSPLTLHLTVPTDFPHANALDESPSFFSSSFSPPFSSLFGFSGPSLSRFSRVIFLFFLSLLPTQRRYRAHERREGEAFRAPTGRRNCGPLLCCPRRAKNENLSLPLSLPPNTKQIPVCTIGSRRRRC